MNQPALLTGIPTWVCIFSIILFSTGVVEAQKSIKKDSTSKVNLAHKVKREKKEKFEKSPAVKIKISGDSFILPDSHTDVINSFGYDANIIPVCFTIWGMPPKNDIAIKLNIDDKSQVNPKFWNGSTPLNAYSLIIKKEEFNVDGSEKKIVRPLTIIFQDFKKASGRAFIEIDGQPQDYFELVFANVSVGIDLHNKVPLSDSITKIKIDTEKKAKPSILTNVKKKIDGAVTVKKMPKNKEPKLSIVAADTVLTDTSNTNAGNFLIESGNAEILSTNVGISHDYSSNINSIDTILIKVKIYGEYKKDHNQLAFEFLDTGFAKHFQILRNPVIINQREWNTALKIQDGIDSTTEITSDKKNLPSTAKSVSVNRTNTDSTAVRTGILEVPLLIKTTNLNDSISKEQYIDLLIKGQSQVFHGSQRINLSIKDKTFWAEIGTNFDLLDNIKTNNFYAGVFLFDKDIIKLATKKKANNVSYTGGVYESQSVSLGQTSASGFTYRDGTSYNIVANKGYPVYRDTGSITTSTAVKSIGLFFSPHIRLTNNKVDEDGVHLFVSVYMELLWQRITSSFDYSKTNLVSTGYVSSDSIAKIPYKEKELDLDYRSHYFGIGVPFYLKHKDFNLYINWVPWGVTTQQFVFVQDSYAANYNNKNPYRPIPPTNGNTNYDVSLLNYARPKHSWSSFYIVQYRLNEVAYGITFSGEIRGLYLKGSKPVVTLGLSKKFDLSEVLKPIVGKF